MLTVAVRIRVLSPTVQAVRGYEMFDKKEDNVLKIILKP